MLGILNRPSTKILARLDCGCYSPRELLASNPRAPRVCLAALVGVEGLHAWSGGGPGDVGMYTRQDRDGLRLIRSW